jgi:TPR repeat protein
MNDLENYKLTQEDIVFINKMNYFEIEPENISNAELDKLPLKHSSSANELIAKMMQIVARGEYDEFADYALYNQKEILAAVEQDDDVAKTLIICYKLGIAQKSGICANNLGALHYMGELVEQDYHKAAELYEMAMSWGCHQSVVNLGYIYEYGRVGEPDYQKAYMYYSLAAALRISSEALYKLGDMFSRGKTFERDIKKAYLLWEKALNSANSIEDRAQAAVRIAPLLVDRANKQYEISYSPLRALQLYQEAEIGLRISIDNGLTYYSKRLQQAIEGQESARKQLENVGLH